MKQPVDEMQSQVGIDTSGKVVRHDPYAVFQRLEIPYRKGLPNIENPEKHGSDHQIPEMDRDEQESQKLASHLINYYDGGIFLSRSPAHLVGDQHADQGNDADHAEMKFRQNLVVYALVEKECQSGYD